MRKADYAALADIINVRAAEARETLANAGQFCDDASKDCARAELGALQHVAQQFASRASVDRPTFLKACGIE